MDETATKKVTELLKRLGDDERAHVLQWLLAYFEDDGRVRSPRAHRRAITLDEVSYFLIRKTQRPAKSG